MSRHWASARYLRDGLLSRVGRRPSPVGPGLRQGLCGIGRGTRVAQGVGKVLADVI
jgi:hypothetical protein